MKKIIEYTIIIAGTTSSLMAEVNKGIQQGWQPIGGVYIFGGGIGIKACQAMVKYEE